LAKFEPLEIHALSKIMDELDYYQILDLEKSASTPEVKKAFHAKSRSFHPDTNRHAGNELLEQCERIAKRITEAYCVLRDPRRRKVYDSQLGEEAGLRIQLAEARTAHARQDIQERQGKTPRGRQFYQKASEDISRSDWAAAERNLKMALTFEADNAFFKQRLEEVRKSKKS
jgi:DnaJ-class molecular chaperone